MFFSRTTGPISNTLYTKKSPHVSDVWPMCHLFSLCHSNFQSKLKCHWKCYYKQMLTKLSEKLRSDLTTRTLNLTTSKRWLCCKIVKYLIEIKLFYRHEKDMKSYTFLQLKTERSNKTQMMYVRSFYHLHL